MDFDTSKIPVCDTCTKSMDLDYNYRDHFDIRVCKTCRDAYPDQFSLLTKTECKEDYLLTDSKW